MALTVNVVPVKPLYLRHFLVFTSDKYFHVTTRQVSYKTIVFNSFEHVKFSAWNLQNADSIDFLIPFEENCCRIPSNACKSQCFKWFKRFKNWDFDVRNKECESQSKKFQDRFCKHCWMNMTLKRYRNSRNN